MLKNDASMSSRLSLGELAFSSWSAAFKHVVGFSLSTFKPIPEKGKGIQVFIMNDLPVLVSAPFGTYLPVQRL